MLMSRQQQKMKQANWTKNTKTTALGQIQVLMYKVQIVAMGVEP